MPHDDYMPKYQCWCEADFQSDRHVQRMPYPSRRLYRALLQAAFVYSTRPYLPDDDEELFMLAEADDLEYWKLHMGPVRKMFTSFTNKDGQQLLERPRLNRDWEQMMGTIQQKKKAGRARQGKGASVQHQSADAQQTAAAAQQQSADALKLKSETETKLKTEKKLNRNETETKPETETDSVSSFSVAVSGTNKSPEGDRILQEVSEELLSHWEEKSGQSGSASDFLLIVDMYGDEPVVEVGNEIIRVIDWCLTASSYWPDKLQGSKGFKSAYKEIHRQFKKYQETVRRVASEQLAAKADRYQSPPPNQNVLAEEQEDENEYQHNESCEDSDDEAGGDEGYEDVDEEPDEEVDEEALLRDRY